jgi:radical SAM protein with 4Fe4S-binding SPASM domain
VVRLYGEILGRAPVPEELSSWVHRSNSRGWPLDQIRESLCSSAEYESIVKPVITEIKATYSKFCFRDPTLREIEFHLNHFRSELEDDTRSLQVIRAGKIRDHLGIRPLHLEMDIVNQCNLRCIMCHFSLESVYKRKREDISVEDFAKIAEEVFPLCKLVGLSFNAEPLLHRKLGDLLSITNKHLVPITYMNTSGILLNARIINEIIEYRLHSLCISIDAATKQTYERIRVGSSFERLLSNIRTINEAKDRLGSITPHIQLNFVLMRSNIMEFPAFIRLAHDLRADSVGAVHMTPLQGLDTQSESLYLDKRTCNQMLSEASKLGKLYNMAVIIPASFRNETDTTLAPRNNRIFFPVDKGENTRSGCLFPWHWVGIHPNGDIRPCGWWYDGEPAMGNIRLQTFEEIWNSESYNKLRSEHQSGLLRSTCQVCPAAGLGNVNNRDAFKVRKHPLCGH